MFDFVSFIPRAIVQGIPLLFGSTGETLTEKSGNLNLGIAGIMYVGGISGVIGAFLYEQAAGGAAGMNGFLAIMIPLLSCLLGRKMCRMYRPPKRNDASTPMFGFQTVKMTSAMASQPRSPKASLDQTPQA